MSIPKRVGNRANKESYEPSKDEIKAYMNCTKKQKIELEKIENVKNNKKKMPIIWKNFPSLIVEKNNVTTLENELIHILCFVFKQGRSNVRRNLGNYFLKLNYKNTTPRNFSGGMVFTKNLRKRQPDPLPNEKSPKRKLQIKSPQKSLKSKNQKKNRPLTIKILKFPKMKKKEKTFNPFKSKNSLNENKQKSPIKNQKEEKTIKALLVKETNVVSKLSTKKNEQINKKLLEFQLKNQIVNELNFEETEESEEYKGNEKFNTVQKLPSNEKEILYGFEDQYSQENFSQTKRTDYFEEFIDLTIANDKSETKTFFDCFFINNH
ncbi:hypothetical protein M0813_04657 [Anaeramoeba flamelloides]|uniref:Uncharacterized protein n=1 Tax=Anaeramoeba flamelloides TaxID=1746091 RepID=A0ABQ8XIZ8_9EUKA|nr:hypothetical protein M0813_04657 [Anaeramoeba flamelloides]